MLHHLKKYLIGCLIIIALGLLFFQGKVEEWWQERSLNHDTRPILGHIANLQGDVKFRKPDTLAPLSAINGMNLHLGDTLLTEDSTATVIFNSGLKAEIQPQSIVVMQNSGSEMTFIKGSVKVLNQGAGITLPPEVIAKTEEKAANPEMALQPITPPEEKPVAPHKHKIVNEKESLPDSYISSVIKNQKTFLNRCYAQHLRTDPDAKGQIETSLTIESDGTISTARVIASSIPDPQLQECIVSTLQRAKFKSFTGDPIIVTYPITFN